MQREKIYEVFDLVLKIQSQSKHYVSMSVSYGSIKVDAQKGDKYYSSEKDYFIDESFVANKINCSERFDRMLKNLESLVEV